MLVPATFGLFSDVYESLPTGSGLQLGMVVQVPNTGEYKMLVKAGGANIADNSALKFDDDAYTVVVATNVGENVCGSQDNAGATVTAAYYFWMSYKGPMDILLAAGISEGAFVAASATDGTLAAGNAANVENRNIVALAGSGAGGATACFVF